MTKRVATKYTPEQIERGLFTLAIHGGFIPGLSALD
jgi:hypothetical protein